MHVLIVEDDVQLGAYQRNALNAYNIVSDLVTCAEDALAWPDYEAIDALILDFQLPGMSGLQFIKKFRGQKQKTPILVLSAIDDWEYKVACLDAGAEDYVVKPVRGEELAARCRALARRKSPEPFVLNLSAGDIEIDTARQWVTVAGDQVILSSMEFRLLRALVERKDRWLTKETAISTLFPSEWSHNDNALEAHVSRLRRKIGPQRVITQRGLGYKIAS